MNTSRALSYIALACLAAVAVGCARAPRDTSGLAVTDSAVVSASFPETWTATREALRGEDFDIHTRDKRGRFVAYSDVRRDLLIVPHRREFIITLQAESPNSTRVTVQTLRQVYGSTLLTYPDWHNRKTTDNAQALALLDRIEAIATGAVPVEAPAEEPLPEPGE